MLDYVDDFTILGCGQFARIESDLMQRTLKIVESGLHNKKNSSGYKESLKVKTKCLTKQRSKLFETNFGHQI